MSESYVYDQGWENERERLAGIEAWLDPGTMRFLDALGVGEGWRCLEAGGGGGSIAAWLAGRVGASGHVVATDLDTRFLDPLARDNLEVRRHDVTADDLEESSYDLVHARMLLEHLPARSVVLKRFAAALKPGGWILVEDLDFSTLINTPAARMPVWPAAARPLLRKINRAFHSFMATAGYDADFARNLPAELAAAGFADVGADARSSLTYGGTPQTTFVRFSLDQLGPALIAGGALTQRDVDRAREHVTDARSFWMSFPVVAAWGRRPA